MERAKPFDSGRIPAIVFVTLSALLSLLLGASLITRLVGWGDLGVPWPSMAITAWFLVGGISALVGSLIEKSDREQTFTSLMVDIVSPPVLLAWAASVALKKVYTRLDKKLTGVSMLNTLQIALFIVTPAGNLTHLLLGLLSIAGLLLSYQGAEMVTHPALPSDATASLFKSLHPFRPNPLVSPDRPSEAAANTAAARTSASP